MVWAVPLGLIAAFGVGRELFFDDTPVRHSNAATPAPAHKHEDDWYPPTGFNLTTSGPSPHQSPTSGPVVISVDNALRYTPTTKPYQPAPQHPPMATTENTDTGRPVHEWQRLTDDWFGLRPKLDDKGIAFDGSLALFGGQNFTGGAETGHGGGAYLLNANVTLDSKKLAGYDGGTFFFNFRTENGLHNSLDGAFGLPSHLYNDARTEVSEVWYEQKLLNDELRIRVGKIDANTEFANDNNGAEFINYFSGHSPTILGFPTDPDPAFGADFFIYPAKNFYAGFGVYDGSGQEGKATGLLGPAEVFHEPSVFLIAEADALWTAPGARDGRLGVGVWHQSGTFTRYDGGTDSGATGPYATLDQTLWRQFPNLDGDKHGISLFALAGYASSEVSPVNYSISGGFKWTGALSNRGDDILGLGASYLAFSRRPGSGFDENGETTVELFYKARISAWLSVQPDLQLIHDPGGVSRQADAVLGTVEAVIDF
jgi:porin